MAEYRDAIEIGAAPETVFEYLTTDEDLPAGASTVEFRLTRIADGTHVDLRHSDLPDTDVRGHADGWANFLPRLAVAGAGGDAGHDDWRPLPR